MTDAPRVQVVTYVNLVNLAEELAFQHDREVLLTFMLRLDELIAEEEFTVNLIKGLKDSLAEDEPMDDATMQDIRAVVNKVLSAIHELDNAISG